MPEHTLLAFKTGRRAIGLAVFTGLTLECSFVRELSSDPESARLSTRRFVRWAVATFPADGAVVESGGASGVRSADLGDAIRDELGGSQRAVVDASPRDVLAAADRPSRRPRQQLRALALALWPVFAARRYNPVALDAAILGLYRQTIRLLL